MLSILKPMLCDTIEEAALVLLRSGWPLPGWYGLCGTSYYLANISKLRLNWCIHTGEPTEERQHVREVPADGDGVGILMRLLNNLDWTFVFRLLALWTGADSS